MTPPSTICYSWLLEHISIFSVYLGGSSGNPPSLPLQCILHQQPEGGLMSDYDSPSMILHWLPLQSGGQNPNALCNLFPFLPARSFLCKLLTTLALSLWLQQTQLTHLGLALDNPVWNHLPLLRHPSFHAGLCSHVTTQAFPVPRPQSPSLLLVSFPVMSTIIFHLSYSLLNPCCPEVCQAQIWHSINTC